MIQKQYSSVPNLISKSGFKETIWEPRLLDPEFEFDSQHDRLIMEFNMTLKGKRLCIEITMNEFIINLARRTI